MFNFFDTSALLAGKVEKEENVYVPHRVFQELEEIKNSPTKDEKIKTKARALVRSFMNGFPFSSGLVEEKDIEKKRKHYNLPANNDGYIIAEAMALDQKGNVVCFTTADSLQYLIAKKASNMLVKYVQPVEEEKELWTGSHKYSPNEENMASLYSFPEKNVLNACVNEYCEIIHENKTTDILRWTGEKYVPIKYRTITSAVGEKWKPLNVEQKMLFDLMQNDKIPVKLTLGNFGSGKTSIMLAHALEAVQRGQFDKIVFVRNNIEVRDTTPLGALPNDETSKLLPYLMPICDHVGQFVFEEMLANGTIEACHLGFLRGRDFKRTILFVDEAENLTVHQVQLLIGRVGKDSMLYMAGDLRQSDKITFEKNSGVRKMIECLGGNPLFGTVKLTQSVRSDVCKLADLMD